jgi:hypothetical protein
VADRFYSVVVGEHQVHQVTEDASTSSEAIELRINDSVYSDKLAVIHGVETLLRYLKSKETNPIA